jgi:hypothetical protein
MGLALAALARLIQIKPCKCAHLVLRTVITADSTSTQISPTSALRIVLPVETAVITTKKIRSAEQTATRPPSSITISWTVSVAALTFIRTRLKTLVRSVLTTAHLANPPLMNGR